MAGELLRVLFDDLRRRHPRALKGVEEARAVHPERFAQIAELFLGWAVKARGKNELGAILDAFVRFSSDVILAQARYEAAGHYEHQSYEACYRELYNQKEEMDDYLWGIYLTNFLWAHHLEISLFYEDRFLARLPEAARIVELAPGHGGWGVWALHRLPQASLQGFDISPSSIEIAKRIAQAAGVAKRAAYAERNALELERVPEACAEACVCCFLIEHLEQPKELLAVIARLLKPGARAFLAGALTAAQCDHIHEFRRESELVSLSEAHGLRVLETLSVNPKRLLPKARFAPRSMALLLQKRVTDTW